MLNLCRQITRYDVKLQLSTRIIMPLDIERESKNQIQNKNKNIVLFYQNSVNLL